MELLSEISVLGICGSLRRNSYNQMLLNAASQCLPPQMSLELCTLHDIPLFNQDVFDMEIPASVRLFREKIASADALLFCSPEYNHSISGVLKNAIDWASRGPNQPLGGNPVGILGASPGNFGTVRAQMALRQVCTAANMLPLSGFEVLVTKASEKFDTEGNLSDLKTKQILTQYLAELFHWTQKIRR